MATTPNPQHSSFPEPVKCKGCLDVGVVHPLDADGKPIYNVTVPCRLCISHDKLATYLGVSSMDSTFKKVRQVKGIENSLAAAKKIIEPETTWKLLLIYGTWGNGKTHLLEAIALELYRQGKWVKVTTFPYFINRLKGTFDKSQSHAGDTTFNEIMDSYCTKPYLLLDDVGSAGSFTEFALNCLETIMLARYRNNLFTVITTNVDYAKLPAFVISRFSDAQKGRIVLNSAVDYRPKVVK